MTHMRMMENNGHASLACALAGLLAFFPLARASAIPPSHFTAQRPQSGTFSDMNQPDCSNTIARAGDFINPPTPDLYEPAIYEPEDILVPCAWVSTPAFLLFYLRYHENHYCLTDGLIGLVVGGAFGFFGYMIWDRYFNKYQRNDDTRSDFLMLNPSYSETVNTESGGKR